MKVKRSNVQLSVNAFGYASHFGMAVPIKLHAVGDQDEEQRELGLHLDRKGDDGIGLSQLFHDDVEFRQPDFSHFLHEKLIMLRVTKGLCLKIIIFVGDVPNEIKQVFQGLALGEDGLQLMNLFRFVHAINLIINTNFSPKLNLFLNSMVIFNKNTKSSKYTRKERNKDNGGGPVSLVENMHQFMMELAFKDPFKIIYIIGLAFKSKKESRTMRSFVPQNEGQGQSLFLQLLFQFFIFLFYIFVSSFEAPQKLKELFFFEFFMYHLLLYLFSLAQTADELLLPDCLLTALIIPIFLFISYNFAFESLNLLLQFIPCPECKGTSALISQLIKLLLHSLLLDEVFMCESGDILREQVGKFDFLEDLLS